MLNVLLTVLASFSVTLLTIPAIMRVAAEKKLFDLPDARKVHNHAIASLGGVGIFIGFTLSVMLTISFRQSPEFSYFIAAALVIFFLGLKDDILVLSPTKKFIGQLVAAAIIIHLADLRIDSMHGLFGITTLPYWLSLPVTYITVIVVINAFNLIDGVDGLAASLGLLSTSLFGLYFLLAGQPLYALLAFALASSLLAFLVFNFAPAKIFMGDSGSLLLGLMNAILVIKFMGVADAGDASFPLTSVVAIGFSFLMIPLLDTLRVFSIRLARGRSPFSPDRNHIHHLLLDRGLNHRQVTLSCVSVNLAFIFLAYFGRPLGPTILLCSLIGSAFGLIALVFYGWKPMPRMVVARSYHTLADTIIPSTTKVVPISGEVAAVEQ
jgi:UDP-GlcNAc:undecaprenyl-phosphate GlcNAc-1-phosphate transferase